jgi:3-methyladenine DNA glycosylase AlkD
VDAEEGMTPAARRFVAGTEAALVPLADPVRAEQVRLYMKDVSSFLGIGTPARRAAQRAAWNALPALDPDDVRETCLALWARPEREYAYAACDLIARSVRVLPAAFLVHPLEALLRDRPWWDTVDALGTAGVTPLVARYPDLVDAMWRWWDSGDRWLVRAAIQHQRGLKQRTDVPRLLAMCDRYAEDREFFIAKAIGWALRDLSAWDADAVRGFLSGHPGISPVARREAVRGLDRSARP